MRWACGGARACGATSEATATDLRAVREFAPRFRHEVWRDALAACGVDDDALAAELSDAYRSARRAGELVDPEAATVLEDLSRDHRSRW